MAFGSVNVPGADPADVEAAREEARKALSAAKDAEESAAAADAELDARLSLLELRYATDVSGNPFTATFASLDGLAVSGVWNRSQARLEF